MEQLNIVAGLDVGSSKVTACIGSLDEEGKPAIVGIGTSKSEGIKHGVVVNIESIQSSIKGAIEQAELMAGVVVEDLYLGISGPHIDNINSKGLIAISNRSQTVSSDDVRRVIEQARAVMIPADHEVIHVLSKEFKVDDQAGVKQPIGMTGIRLEADVHIITGLISAIQNLYKGVAAHGYKIADIVFSPLASSEILLSEDEKELGIVLIDIGGGTTDILVYIDGGVSYSCSIPVAGSHVTSDISIGLRTPMPAAEDIKLKYGCANTTLIDPAEYIQVPSVGGRPERRLNRQELCQIIEPRVEEIMQLVDEKLIESGKKPFISAGAVVTGGGVNLEGCLDVVERILNIPVRIGYPQGIIGLKEFAQDTSLSTAVGLVQYGARQQYWHGPSYVGGQSGIFGKMVNKLKRLFNE